MIIRMSDARAPGDEGSARWWELARQSAMKGQAPHGIHQLLLDPDVKHVDVFPTEVTQVWDWAAQFEGWVHDGKKQLKGVPHESIESTVSYLTDDSLKEMRKYREGGPR
jgi:hypothetical protein